MVMSCWPGATILSRLRSSLTHDSTYGRDDGGVLQIELSLLQGSLCLLRLRVGSLSARLLQGDLLRTRLSVAQLSLRIARCEYVPPSRPVPLPPPKRGPLRWPQR